MTVFTRKTWADNASGATPITAAELNRIEQGISDLDVLLRPIQTVTAWPTTGQQLGDEAIISATGEHRVWKGATLGWRLASDHSVPTTASLPAVATAYEGMEVYVQDLNAYYRCWDMGSGVLAWKSRTPFCRVTLGTDETYSGGDITIDTWNTTADDDSDAIWNKANNRMVIPVTGIYRMHLHVTASVTAAGSAVARLSSTTSHTNSITSGMAVLSGSTECHVDASTEVTLNAGTFLYALWWSSNTGCRPVISIFGTKTSWSLEYVRPAV